jgi:hypothetical protein
LEKRDDSYRSHTYVNCDYLKRLEEEMKKYNAFTMHYPFESGDFAR